MTTQNAFYNAVNSLQPTKHMDMEKKKKRKEKLYVAYTTNSFCIKYNNIIWK